MSVNNCNTPDGRGVILFFGERLLINYDGCDLKLSGKGSQPTGNYCGTTFLTSHRVLFLPKKMSGEFRSLSMPFVYMKQVDIKQPTFGANKLEGYLDAEFGSWEGRLPFSFTFKKGGAIEFGKALLELGSQASKMRNTYTSPPPPDFAQYYSCPPPAFAPPYGDPYYGFMQPHPAFGPPMPDMLYQSNCSPPYPGAIPPSYQPVGPGAGISTPMPYPPQASNINGAPAAPYPQGPPPAYTPNAVSDGYYFQEDPHTVYAPATQFPSPSAPPMEQKKND